MSGNGLQIFTVGGTMSTLRTSGNVSYSRQRPSPQSTLSSYISGSSSLRLREGRVTGLYALSWDVARSYVVSQTMSWTYMAQCCGFTAEAQIFSYPDGSGVADPVGQTVQLVGGPGGPRQHPHLLRRRIRRAVR